MVRRAVDVSVNSSGRLGGLEGGGSGIIHGKEVVKSSVTVYKESSHLMFLFYIWGKPDNVVAQFHSNRN